MERTKVVAYLRVSTEGQAEAGVSLAAQRAKAEAYASLYDLELVAVIEDAGVSAKSLNRLGLTEALAMLDAGTAEGLLVAKLDRLTRSVKDLGTLLDLGLRDRYSLLSVAEQVDTRTAGGRLVLNVLASVSEWERETIGERTREALEHLKNEGVRLGGEALGWERSTATDDQGRKRWIEVDGEAKTVSRIIELHESGKSNRAIARSLEAEGRRTKRGGRWSHKQVGNVLRRAVRASR